MSRRRSVVKTVLWASIGVLAAATLGRFRAGLGATTGLSDAAPWGLWIAFDVMAGVALAAGGFVLAATVYIFGLEKYRPFARPAILTALLGYAAVAIGLLYDLGLPWRIWHPVVFPQPHSVLFEVAMCVLIYLTVLLLEFLPVALEHPVFRSRIYRAIRHGLQKVTIPLVILGIVLSTLHQSSLGSLFLIAPQRLHPLWYSPIIWVLFYVSAIGLGLMMVTLESLVSAWLFNHRLRMNLLAGLGRAACVVLFLYVGVRLVDLAVRGVLLAGFDGSGMSFLFWFELAVSALIPATLLAFRRVRQSMEGMTVACVLSVLGIIGYRFDVCLVAFQRPEGMPYFPTWMEFAVSIGIVAGAALVFIFFVEHLKVYPDADTTAAEGVAGERRVYDPRSMWGLLPERLAAPRRYTLALIAGAAVAVAFLPGDALFGPKPSSAPVAPSRTVEGLFQANADGFSHTIAIEDAGPPPAADTERISLIVIDGNRDGRLVLFPHDAHARILGGEGSCGTCHHQSLPFDRNTPCTACHRDMYSSTDIFDHSSHIAATGGNQGCRRCHQDADRVKSRETATPCEQCHVAILAGGEFIEPPSGTAAGYAAGYADAMHGLCIKCHEAIIHEDPHTYPASFAGCLNCHRDTDDSPLRRMPPHVTHAWERAVGGSADREATDGAAGGRSATAEPGAGQG